MSLITYVRQQVISQCWQRYLAHCDQAKTIINALSDQAIVLDHFAIIDLPSKNSGIATLNQIFATLNYLPQGRDYLVDKQNEFMWLAPSEAESQKATEVMPQIVIADFSLENLTPAVRDIINHYADQSQAFPWRQFHQLCGKAYHDDKRAAETLIKMIVQYCFSRDWNTPVENDYQKVKEYNELLAWVLLHGRKINHFGLAVHHLKQYSDLSVFNHFVSENLNIPLNQQGGVIKGNEEKGIMQSSTESKHEQPFVEFVWRFSKKESPIYWNDYFTGFIGAHANYVIESVFDL